MDNLNFALLANKGAIEIDNYLLGREKKFRKIHELSKVLKDYQLKGDDDVLSYDFPYIPLWKALCKNSKKNIRYVSELSLETRMFRSELDKVPDNSEILEDLRSFLCDFSGELIRWDNFGF